MRKAGYITLAIFLLAVGVIFIYKMQSGKEQVEEKKGTLVKEFMEWKKYYM